MKLRDVRAVVDLTNERSHLVTQRDGQISITIDGWAMPREFVDTVAPGIRLELRHRIEEIDGLLRGYGIEIEPSC